MFVNSDLASGLQDSEAKKVIPEGSTQQQDLERHHSTGMGHGHLADVHVVRSSPTPPMHLRFPKTITG